MLSIPCNQTWTCQSCPWSWLPGSGERVRKAAPQGMSETLVWVQESSPTTTTRIRAWQVTPWRTGPVCAGRVWTGLTGEPWAPGGPDPSGDSSPSPTPVPPGWRSLSDQCSHQALAPASRTSNSFSISSPHLNYSL